MSRQNNKCKAQEETNMCRKLVVTNESFLGARPICYEAYSLPKGEVVELTEKQIKDALKGFTTDEVYGFALTESGELILDTENFFTTNMMKKVHTNTLIPMVEDDCLANLFVTDLMNCHGFAYMNCHQIDWFSVISQPHRAAA